MCLDPGIGFGKTVAHNFELVRRLDELAALGRPVLVGFSRKSSLGKIIGRSDAKVGTAAASVGAAVAAYDRGATILRVHDVREHVEALAAAKAVARMKVELDGLEVFGYHGVLGREQRDGQLFLFDVELEVGDRGATDRLEERSTTRRSRTRSARSSARRFDLLEALATATADAAATSASAGARARARSQAGRAGGMPVEYTAVTVERP